MSRRRERLALDALERGTGAMGQAWSRLGDLAIRVEGATDSEAHAMGDVGALVASLRRVERELEEARIDLEPARDEPDDDQDEGAEPGRVLS